ncbi:hypothetical protein RugamoR57_56410 [Duganella caerulea]|uniref:hypothetical protein n=1 Tax=Duganella caerulea TaxID=2885762 RepID=UPI0030E90B4B
MHKKYIVALGKWMMHRNALSIGIVDDEDAYFNEKMIAAAGMAGFSGIERHKIVDQQFYNRLLSVPYDIIILDVKGSVSPEVAVDGLALAKNLKENTHTYIVITSAHQFHLSNQNACADYVIEQRTLTTVDFVNEIKMIIENYLNENLRFYKKIAFKTGYFLAKSSLGHV